jgi:TPR repeat protein
MATFAATEYNLGVSYHRGLGVVKDYGEAVKWFRKAAEDNHAQAQFYLGVCYSRGEGVAEDQAEAVSWYRKSADQNLALAEYFLGLGYKKGEGVAKNQVEAYKWFWLAAAQGNQDAKQKMGELENEMIHEQIAEGEKRARDFKPR